ncbi:MAG: hypothetical protein LBD42_09685 [Desulfovibrio sp.]|jgi:hypothetical protein|nr:hypothetical protein [Desulfovibrio sp.]
MTTNTLNTFYTRQMLLRYGRQLIAARRLARYDQLLGRTWPRDKESVAAKRQDIIERIAREIMENLIFSGSDNPTVQEVKERLIRELGEELIFRYPPAAQDFKIFRNRGGEEKELSEMEKQQAMAQLWDVTLRTVDETML